MWELIARFCRWRASVAHARMLKLGFAAIPATLYGSPGASAAMRREVRRVKARRDRWDALAERFDPTPETGVDA